MSSDEQVTRDLIETLEDGKEGFSKGAEKLDSSDAPELAVTFRRFSGQRGQFSSELRQMATAYGDHVDESGSVVASLHRGWMSLRDALSGSDPKAVLKVAEQGEEHAVNEYEKALAADISANLRTTVERQLAEIKTAHAEVRSLHEAHS